MPSLRISQAPSLLYSYSRIFTLCFLHFFFRDFSFLPVVLLCGGLSDGDSSIGVSGCSMPLRLPLAIASTSLVLDGRVFSSCDLACSPRPCREQDPSIHFFIPLTPRVGYLPFYTFFLSGRVRLRVATSVRLLFLFSRFLVRIFLEIVPGLFLFLVNLLSPIGRSRE